LKEVEAGRLVKEVCRENDTSDATYYNWKSKYGGMEASVSGTVKMTPSGNRKLTPHFVNLHLIGGAYAEVGNMYGNTNFKWAG
jgi:putative transposase